MSLMIDRIRKGAKPHVYLREWRKAKNVRAPDMAERLGIERESYYRLERQPFTLSIAELLVLADALGIGHQQLWEPPPAPGLTPRVSLDAIVAGEPDTIEMRDQYRLRRNFIVNALNGMGLKCHLPRGSFYAFPNITSTGLASKEFAVRLLQEERVACVPGGAFGPGGEGFVRCCFATSLEQIQVACERMNRFVNRLRQG